MNEKERLEEARERFEKKLKESKKNTSETKSRDDTNNENRPGMTSEAFRKNLGCGG